ncbi:MAG: ribosome assembly RNA-binding protein YhbY [Gammaproteobacteria bacterium]|nr:MAG: ribosome assembly RNA-binding protein YhbY [Gammaproteobacteria bacterium]
MSLSTKFKQQLKARAHKLKPVILIGQQGLTPAVEKEINRALDDHELIKIRIAEQDREIRKELFSQLCETAQAELVQVIGNIGVVYRASKQ